MTTSSEQVNIALVNELKMVLARMGIDIWEVLDAAETKPFGFHRFNPGVPPLRTPHATPMRPPCDPLATLLRPPDPPTVLRDRARVGRALHPCRPLLPHLEGIPSIPPPSLPY